jgi:basic membrane protein A and related proteins
VKRTHWLPRVTMLCAFVVLAALLTGTGLAAQSATIKMAVVTDIGSLQDKSFNQAANTGRLIAQKKLKVQTRVYQTATANDRVPNLQRAARDGYQLVFGTGFLMGDPLSKVAPAFANTKFVGIDVDWNFVEGKPKNVRGIQFREQEAGYLAGFVAGLVVKYQTGPDVVSAVGANSVPPIVRYMAGYKAGAKKANSKVKVLLNLANDPTFNDQAKCAETAINQLQRKSQIIFQVAGGCGLGALREANKAKKWGIGVDVNQNYINSRMLTSAMKRVDNAVYLTTRQFKANPSGFRGGFNAIFNVKNGGIDVAPLNAKTPRRAQILKQLTAIKKQIAAGKIKIPTKY